MCQSILKHKNHQCHPICLLLSDAEFQWQQAMHSFYSNPLEFQTSPSWVSVSTSNYSCLSGWCNGHAGAPIALVFITHCLVPDEEVCLRFIFCILSKVTELIWWWNKGHRVTHASLNGKWFWIPTLGSIDWHRLHIICKKYDHTNNIYHCK